MESSAFERWLSAKYGIGDSRWVMLDALNQAVTHSKTVPGAEDFISRLERAGLINPVKQLRNFLRMYPDQLEARADLLKQLRRRAVKLTTEKIKDINSGAKNELDPETDLIIWGSLAQEVDVAFGGNWPGIVIPFFRVEEGSQLEKHSPTMKSVFTRHIAKVEAVLAEAPNSQSLWDIWAWMARSLENRPWKNFLKRLDPFTYPEGLAYPAPNVAVWLTSEARAAGDWEQVVELAKVGKRFDSYPGEARTTWFPGGWSAFSRTDEVKGYSVVDSTFMPMLEGLLRLGRLEEANGVFEDVLFFDGEGKRETLVNLARSTGHPNLAQAWLNKLPDKSVLRFMTPTYIGIPRLVWNDRSVGTPIAPSKINQVHISGQTATDVFGWPKDEERWALMDKTGRLAVEGKEALSEELIFEALEKMGYRNSGELAVEFLREHSSNTYAHYVLASYMSFNARLKIIASNLHTIEMLSDEQDYALWGECAKEWLAWYENDMALNTTLTSGFQWGAGEGDIFAANSNLMKAASERIIPRLESALKQQPMSSYLWNTWVVWRRVNGNTRPFAPLLAELAPSPLVPPGSFPPPMVMDVYYRELTSQEKWSEVAKLLSQSWERDLGIVDVEIKKRGRANFHPQTWITGKLLISALLRDGRASEAEDIVEAWASRGGQFRDATEIIELAKQLGYGGLADKWGKMQVRNGIIPTAPHSQALYSCSSIGL